MGVSSEAGLGSLVEMEDGATGTGRPTSGSVSEPLVQRGLQ